MPPQLITIPISHYGERARWALDLAAIDYQEVHHLQMFSWLVAYGHARNKTLPILVDGDTVLTNSREIALWASERASTPLWPSGARERVEVDRLSTELADVFGVETRRVVYEWFFRSGPAVMPYNAGRAPYFEEAILRRGFGAATAFASRYLGAQATSIPRALDIINRTFDETAERMEDGRRFLISDQFTLADLTFATMAAPCLLPARYGTVLPSPSIIPADARDRVEQWRSHPAGIFALGLYEDRPTPRGRYERPMRVAPRALGFPE